MKVRIEFECEIYSEKFTPFEIGGRESRLFMNFLDEIRLNKKVLDIYIFI